MRMMGKMISKEDTNTSLVERDPCRLRIRSMKHVMIIWILLAAAGILPLQSWGLDTTLIRLSDGQEFDASVKNSVTLWQQIIFLPTTLLGSVAWGTYGAQKDSALYLYDTFEKAGAFERGSEGPAVSQ